MIKDKQNCSQILHNGTKFNWSYNTQTFFTVSLKGQWYWKIIFLMLDPKSQPFLLSLLNIPLKLKFKVSGPFKPWINSKIVLLMVCLVSVMIWGRSTYQPSSTPSRWAMTRGSGPTTAVSSCMHSRLVFYYHTPLPEKIVHYCRGCL